MDAEEPVEPKQPVAPGHDAFSLKRRAQELNSGSGPNAISAVAELERSKEANLRTPMRPPRKDSKGR